MNVLVLNAGSSSLKYQVLPAEGEALARGVVERLDGPASVTEALTQITKAAVSFELGAVGHRVVHGGDAFVSAVVIDDAVERDIEACVPLAPLHNPANLAGIRAARAAFPSLPQVAVFDTAFHAHMPRWARSYAISPALAERHGFKRYGFHGTSHAFVAERAAQFLGRPLSSLRLITLHLGNGASACAVELGQSVETSMGMTPLEGLVMGTRSGDLDPGIVLALVRSGSSADEVQDLLTSKSGLKGLSGVGNDVRDLEQRAEAGDEACQLSLEVFAHRVRKYVGAYAAVLGKVDAVVLTGGIGENARGMRRRILQRLEGLGVVLDEALNASATVSFQAPVALVSAPRSAVTALVVKTDEERSIAEQTRSLVKGPDRAG